MYKRSDECRRCLRCMLIPLTTPNVHVYRYVWVIIVYEYNVYNMYVNMCIRDPYILYVYVV